MLEISTFECDVTPPLGTPLAGGVIEPATVIDDPQYALGFVLHGDEDPIVLVAVDCLGIYGTAHDRFLQAVAEAAQTRPQRVLLCSVHQHDASWHAPDAQKLAEELDVDWVFCDVNHFEHTIESTVAALRESLSNRRRVTHVGVGRSRVHEVASNRRILGVDGKVAFMRNSRCPDDTVRGMPEGLIDPMLTALVLYEDDRPLLTVNHYAVHPMSHYGKGHVSSDFCGLARAQRRADNPDNFQIFVNGCAGNIGAGKYNDGSPESGMNLRQRMYDAMVEAPGRAEPKPLDQVRCADFPMHLPVREDPGFTYDDCMTAMSSRAGHLKDYLEDAMRTGRIMNTDLRHSAQTLQWRKRATEPIHVPMLNFGVAKMILLPGEPFIEFQLDAQAESPEQPVIVMGYGNGGPGYLCTDIAYYQGGYESNLPAYTGRGAEAVVRDTLRKALAG